MKKFILNPVLLKGFVLSGLLCLMSVVMAQVNPWTDKAEMPTARTGLSASAVNGKIYAIGGAFTQTVYKAVEEYDPVTDTWATKADMPTARAFLSASTVNGKIYVIGGGKSPQAISSEVEEYDPGSDTALITSVESNINMNPGPFELCQNYPNPFHMNTSIQYKLDETAFIKLSVYDLLGHEVGVLVNEKQSPGEYKVIFNTVKLAYGIYYYKMGAKSESGQYYAGIKKLILSK